MAEPRCANCGSPRVQPGANNVGCEVCGAATSYEGELVHGPTEQSHERVSGPGGAGALPPSAPQNPGQSRDGITTTQDAPTADGEPDVEDDEPEAGDEFDGLTRDELYERATVEGIDGRSSMSKDELLAALRG